MFPNTLEDIDSHPNAQYGVKLVFDYMAIFTVIELPRDYAEEETLDEDSLTERAINGACLVINDHYGLNLESLGIQDAEITCEGVSR